MPLDIKILQDVGNPKSGAFVVTLDGSLDTATAPELERLLVPVLAGTAIFKDVQELDDYLAARQRMHEERH
jgi:anti-anti-sigma regulatory factor